MKINEKNLCVFATNPPYDLEGYLNKRGEVNKAWQKRYFVLKGNLLFYFEKKSDKEPLGLIIVEGCTIELSEDNDQYSFQMVFNGNRTYILAAETQDEMELWMKALTCAGYEYKKLMVAELRRQLDEIEDTQKKRLDGSVQASTPKPPPRRHNPFNRPAPPPPNMKNNGQTTSKTTNDLIVSPVDNSIGSLATPVGGAGAHSRSATNLSSAASFYNNMDVHSAGSSSFYANNVDPHERQQIQSAIRLNSGKSIDNNKNSKNTSKVFNDQEITFLKLHNAFKEVVFVDINNYRLKKQPLIDI